MEAFHAAHKIIHVPGIFDVAVLHNWGALASLLCGADPRRKAQELGVASLIREPFGSWILN